MMTLKEIVESNSEIKKYVDDFLQSNSQEAKDAFNNLLNQISLVALEENKPITIWVQPRAKEISHMLNTEEDSQATIQLLKALNADSMKQYQHWNRAQKQKCVYSVEAHQKDSNLTQSHYDLAINLWCRAISDLYNVTYCEPAIVELRNGKILILSGLDRYHFSEAFNNLN